MKLSPTSKKILLIAGAGAFIAGSLVMPGLPKLFLGRKFRDSDFDDFLKENEWAPFDERRLKEKLKRMQKAKLVKISMHGLQHIVQVTEKGKKQLLRYQLENLAIDKPKEWDKKWRIVTYDVPKESKRARDALRETLKRLGFLQLQKSVYLYPYPCSEVIEFIRQVYGIGENVTLLTVGYLENEEAYKEFFNL